MQSREYLNANAAERKRFKSQREGVCEGVLKRVYTDDKMGQRYITVKGTPYCKLVISASNMNDEGGDLYHNLFENQILEFLYAIGRPDLYNRDINLSFNNIKRLIDSKFTFDLIKKKIKNKLGESCDVYNISRFHSRESRNGFSENVFPMKQEITEEEIPF